MSNEALLLHPRGQISSGGKLVQVTSCEFTLTNGVKLSHTLSASPAGYVLGKKEVQGTFSGIISTEGEERDWCAAVENATNTPFTYKSAANRRFQIQGVLNSFKWSADIENEIQFTCNFVGKKVPG